MGKNIIFREDSENFEEFLGADIKASDEYLQISEWTALCWLIIWSIKIYLVNIYKFQMFFDKLKQFYCFI